MSNIGELFILGFHGTRIPDWLREFAAEFGLGGVILFDYYCQTKKYENNVESPAQVKELCAEIHALPSRPLVFVDQEGGKVRRFKDRLGFTPYPSQLQFNKLPQAEKLEVLERVYRELKDLGVDVNMSPVVDLNTNPTNPDIGAVERSFSADPSEVEENAKLIFSVAARFGLGLTLKHFPGLGGATVNSHEELTDLSSSVTDAQLAVFRGLLPFCESKAMVMSHGFVKQWDKKYPVSLSLVAVEMVRGWNRDALLITDDMQMQGLQKVYGTGEACALALRAGLDMLCIGNNLMNEEANCFGYAKKIKELGLGEASLQRVKKIKEKFGR